VTVRAHWPEIIDGIYVVALLYGSQRLQVMDVNEAIADFAIGRAEVETTGHATRSIVLYTGLTSGRIPFIGVYLDLADSAFRVLHPLQNLFRGPFNRRGFPDERIAVGEIVRQGSPVLFLEHTEVAWKAESAMR
jgi:hypothetical protein